MKVPQNIVAGAVLATPSRLTPERVFLMPPHDTSIPDGFKRCTRCREVKATTSEFFARDKSRRDGWACTCKVCKRAYRQENIESYLERDRKYYRANRESRMQYMRDNREARAEKQKIYRKENREKISRREKKYYEQHQEYYSKLNKAYREKHKERLSAYREARKDKEKERYHAWYVANRHEVYAKTRRYKARKLNAEGTHTAADIKAQYERQKGRCYYCHKKVGKDYHVDHIVPLSRGGSNDPENLVIACPHCNLSKQDKFPHEWPQGGRLL